MDSNLLLKLKNNISLKTCIIMTFVSVIIYCLLTYGPFGTMKLQQITNGINIIDVEFGYTLERVYEILTGLGAEGRKLYSNFIIPIDLVFGISYMLFLVLWIGYFINTINAKSNLLNILFLFPLLTMIFDWAENGSIFIMIKQFPDISHTLCKFTSVFTQLKFSLFLISILTIIFLLLYAIYSKMKKNYKT